MEAAQKKTIHHHTKDVGIRETQVQPPRKTDTESYYAGAEKVSGLNDLLSRQHRPDGKHTQVPVGDIPEVKRREGQLERPSPRLQYLMDHVIPPEQQGSSDLPDFMSPDP